MKPTVRVAFESIRAASRMLLSEQQKADSIHVEYKTKQELVSKIDTLSQDIIFNDLQTKYPNHQYISEEQGPTPELTDEPTWVLDPLDGTHNYLNQLPFFTISLALYENKKPIHALVYAPSFDELYYASKGEGAYRNQSRIRTSNRPNSISMIGIEQSVSPLIIEGLEKNKSLIKIRRFGCTSLSICYVACNKLQLFYTQSPNLWDSAAAELIALESGSIVNSNKSHYIIAPPKTYSMFKDVFK
ncbi:MAG TPA: inositol monophosphatase family protein [Gammaproteobacteria bacterium]|nr:inositol monophosphatase family protein [Gammaproteobacteria bacterium]